MAKKVEIGLELTGDEACDFITYMNNPHSTPAADECMKAALSQARREQ